MQQDYFSFNHPDEDVVKRYEQMLDRSQVTYFDVEEFEVIIEHYLDHLLVSKAFQVVEVAVKQHPYTASLQYLHAKILYKKGQYVKAMRILEPIQSLLQSEVEYWLLKGELYLKLNQPIPANQCFNHSLDIEESDKDQTCLDIAYLFIGEENYDLAIRFLKKGYRYNPQNSELLFELGTAYLEVENYEKSLYYLNKQLDLDAYLDETWFTVGLIYWDKYNDMDKALEAFDYVTVINEKHEMAQFFKGQIAFKEGDYVQAIEYYKDFGKLSVQASQSQLLIAECYEELNDTDKAIEYYNMAMEDNNSRFDAWLGMGYCYLDRKEYDKAIVNFKNVLNERKDFEEAWSGLGDSYFALGDEEQAIDSYEKSLELNPLQPELWSVYADVFISQNRFVEAIDLLNKGLAYKPKSKDLLFQLAICYYQNLEQTKAIDTLKLLKERGYKKLNRFFEFCPDAAVNTELAELLK